MAPSWQILFAIVHCFANLITADSPIGLLGYSLYGELRTCAQPCLGGYNVASQIIYVIGCPAPWYDSCYCRGMQDLSSTVTSFLSSCVNSGCSSDSVDLASAFACYNSYCEGRGISHIANNEATTTQEIAATTVNYVPTSTSQGIAQPTANNGFTQPSTPSPSSGSGSAGVGTSGSSGLSLSDKIALGVGIGIGIPSLLATIAVCLGCGRHRSLA